MVYRKGTVWFSRSVLSFIGFSIIAFGGIIGALYDNPKLAGTLISFGGFIISIGWLVPK